MTAEPWQPWRWPAEDWTPAEALTPEEQSALRLARIDRGVWGADQGAQNTELVRSRLLN